MSTKQTSILVGGLVGGVLSTSPISIINCLCCLGVILGALAGVWYFTDQEQATIEAGDGALLGAGSGVAAAVFSLLFTFILGSIGIVPSTEEQLQQAMQQEGMTPEGRDILRNIADFTSSVSGMVILTGVTAVVYAIFGAIGGAIGASVFTKGDDTPSMPEVADDDF